METTIFLSLHLLAEGDGVVLYSDDKMNIEDSTTEFCDNIAALYCGIFTTVAMLTSTLKN